METKFRPTGKKISSHKISLEPPDSPPPIWPPFRRIAVQLDLLILLTCICFVPLFHICILPISFFWFVQSNILSNIDNVMALFITVFPLIGRWDLHSLQLILSIICIFRWDLWNMNVMPSPITLSTFRPQGRMTQNQPQNFSDSRASPQLAVGVHDFGSPLQKQRIPANYPVHRNASEKFSFQSHRNWTLLSPSMACTKPNQTTPPWTIGHHKLHCILNHKQQILCQYWYHMAANFHQMVVLCVKSTHVCCKCNGN